MTNHCFAKQNTISPNMGYGIKNVKSFDTNGHPFVVFWINFEGIGYCLLLFLLP
jgi:hypothetical protein